MGWRIGGEVTGKRDIIWNESNKIIWPTYNFDSKYKKIKGNVTTKKIKLYSHVIWFSNINSIFDKIIKNDSENKNIYQEILQLYNFPEMKIVAEILTNSLFQNHDESHLQPYCIDDMYYHLNSQFLARLIKDDLWISNFVVGNCPNDVFEFLSPICSQITRSNFVDQQNESNISIGEWKIVPEVVFGCHHYFEIFLKLTSMFSFDNKSSTISVYPNSAAIVNAVSSKMK